MIRNFTTEIKGTSFRFNTLSSTTLQAFQVYVQQQPGKPLRFHMQRKGETFFITDPSICPTEYLAIEAALSEAILNSQEKLQA